MENNKKNSYINVSQSASLKPQDEAATPKQTKNDMRQVTVARNNASENKTKETPVIVNNSSAGASKAEKKNVVKKEKNAMNKKTWIYTASALVVVILCVAILPKLGKKNVAPENNQPYQDEYNQSNSSSQNQNSNTNQNNSQPGNPSSQQNSNQQNSTCLYKIKTLEELNVRSGHSKKDSVVRVIKTVGSTLEVYEEYRDSEYLWRRIGTNEWIADNGKWVQVLSGENGSGQDSQTNGCLYKVKTLEELNVRSGHSKKDSIVRVIKKVGSTLEVYEEYRDSEYLWRRIGPNEWIADNGEWVQVLD